MGWPQKGQGSRARVEVVIPARRSHGEHTHRQMSWRAATVRWLWSLGRSLMVDFRFVWLDELDPIRFANGRLSTKFYLVTVDTFTPISASCPKMGAYFYGRVC